VTPQVMIPVDRAVLALPPALDRLAVEPLCRAVQQRLAAGEPLLIDAIRVDRVSTAAIQVLLAAARSAAARGVVFRVSGASAALNGIVAWCGEQRWLSGSIPSTIRGRCAR